MGIDKEKWDELLKPDKSTVISMIADIIGAGCTCSGRANRDKNLELAGRIFDGLVKKGML